MTRQVADKADPTIEDVRAQFENTKVFQANLMPNVPKNRLFKPGTGDLICHHGCCRKSMRLEYGPKSGAILG